MKINKYIFSLLVIIIILLIGLCIKISIEKNFLVSSAPVVIPPIDKIQKEIENINILTVPLLEKEQQLLDHKKELIIEEIKKIKEAKKTKKEKNKAFIEFIMSDMSKLKKDLWILVPIMAFANMGIYVLACLHRIIRPVWLVCAEIANIFTPACIFLFYICALFSLLLVLILILKLIIYKITTKNTIIKNEQ